MEIGYKEIDYQMDTNHIEDGIYMKDNILYVMTINDRYSTSEVSDVIDIRKIIQELKVGNELEGIFIYGNQEEIVNINLLNVFTNLKIIHIRNVEVGNLEWLIHLEQLESFTLSSTLGYEKGVMQDSFYHPIKYLKNLSYLDVSFSRFSEKAVYLTDKKSIVDDMKMLHYLNLRETHFRSDSFFSLLEDKNIVVNFIDNSAVKLDFSKFDNVKLITKITAYKDGSTIDISRYIGE